MYILGPNNYHLKSWMLEGSADGNSLIELDRRENSSDLNSSFTLKTFSILRSDPVRGIRQIDPNLGNGSRLIFTSFKVFRSVVRLERN
jgi:hypothetical protein